MKQQRYKTWFIACLVVGLSAYWQQAQAQTVICQGEEIVLTLSGYTGTIQWEFSTTLGGTYQPLSGVVGDSASIFPTGNGFYRAAVLTGTCNPFFSDTMEIVVHANPIADAGSGSNLCSGSTIAIGGSPSASGGTAPYSYAWTPATGLSATNVSNPNANPAATTTYTLVVTDSNGCSGTDNTVVTVVASPIAEAGLAAGIACSDSTQLSGSATGGAIPYSYAWTPISDLSNAAIANPWASPSATTVYTLAVTDANGCTGSDTVSVIVSGGGHGTLTFAYTGALDTSFVVPCANSLVIEVWGAEGGNNTNSSVTPGMGAYQKGTFLLSTGSKLKILVGEKPSFGSGNGGGGGSFVTLMNNAPLIISGGGGGSAQTTDSPDKHGQAGQTGGTGAAGGGNGGTAGNGGGIGPSGFQSGAGGGLLTSGSDGWTSSTGGIAFIAGGSGGTANSPARGGFGGGGSGSSYVVGGAGGGYSGGGSGGNLNAGVGGGGGSYNSGTNPVSTSGVRAGNGQVVITW